MNASGSSVGSVLAGDIGGTKILLELSLSPYLADGERIAARYASSDYPDFQAVLQAFLEQHAPQACRIDRACFGIAGPVAGSRARVTNLPWEIDAATIARRFGIGSVKLINDFAAAAGGIDELEAGNLVTLQAGSPDPSGPRVIVGAGTGFGAACAVWGDGGYRVIPGEGGHAGFAPTDEIQAALWQDIFRREGRVSVEHVVSGPGLLRIYRFLRDTGRFGGSPALDAGASPETITVHALERGDALALSALDMFIACYGAAAGDRALAVLASGGVYIAGGIAPGILPRLAEGGFIRAFNAKGAQGALMAGLPVRVVIDARVGLLGARRLALLPEAVANM